MRPVDHFLISVGCLLGALGACSGGPAADGTPNDGHLVATDGGAGVSSTGAAGSSTTSTAVSNGSTATTGALQGGSGGSAALDASSVTVTSDAATTGMGGSTTGGSSTTGLGGGGSGAANVGGYGGATATTTADASTGGGAGGTSGGAGGTSSTGGAGGSGGTGITFPEGCQVSMPVSFTNDIQPFLTTSCGKGVDSGCHVTDAESTMGSLCPDGSNNCGFTHAYDWITAGAHASSCPETPTPKRFEVVLDVIDQANPPSCSASRIMPPPGMGTALTECQIAALAAWLVEPMVVQTHRADDSSPEEPYAMPPFN